MHKSTVLTLLLFISYTCCARKKIKTQEVLQSGGIVSSTPIGLAGTYTENYKKIWSISEERNAEQHFIEMIEDPNLDIQLYALMGLKIISSDKYNIYKEKLLTIETLVPYGLGGCMVGELQGGKIVENIDKYPLTDPR